MKYMLRCGVVLGLLSFGGGCALSSEQDKSADTETSTTDSALSAPRALTNCTGGSNLSRRFVSATCTETTATNWDLQVECERPSGDIVLIKGSIVFGPGTGTSVAQCPVGTEVGSESIVEL
jgi:hypothetical protein